MYTYTYINVYAYIYTPMYVYTCRYCYIHLYVDTHSLSIGNNMHVHASMAGKSVGTWVHKPGFDVSGSLDLRCGTAGSDELFSFKGSLTGVSFQFFCRVWGVLNLSRAWV